MNLKHQENRAQKIRIKIFDVNGLMWGHIHKNHLLIIYWIKKSTCNISQAAIYCHCAIHELLSYSRTEDHLSLWYGDMNTVVVQQQYRYLELRALIYRPNLLAIMDIFICPCCRDKRKENICCLQIKLIT